MIDAPEVKESATETLARLALQERAELMEERQKKKAKAAQRSAKQIKDDALTIANKQRQYSRCDHLQGNHKLGEEPMQVRPDLSHHTFQSGTQRIRCNKCGFKWFRGDTAKLLKRNGKTEKNPTGMSYKDAYTMFRKGMSKGNKPSKGFVLVNNPTPDEE